MIVFEPPHVQGSGTARLGHGSVRAGGRIIPDLGVRSAADIVLPAATLLAWVVVWATRRRVPRLFFALAGAAALLCFPIGAWSIARQPPVEDCPLLTACVDYSPVAWWVNGVCGLLTVVVLAMVSGVARLLAGAGRWPDAGTGPHPTDDVIGGRGAAK